MVRELVRIALDEFTRDPATVLERIVDEQEAVLIEKEGEIQAIVTPVAPSTKHWRGRSPADREAFMASAGGWRHLVDTDKLLADIHESRRRSSRPPVEL